MKKEQYEEPWLEVVKFSGKDIITTSDNKDPWETPEL